MIDYKKMYLTMLDASERAIEVLIAAQRECEELYINAADWETKQKQDGLGDTESRAR